MICPCRVDKVYEVKKVGESVVITAEKEVYPDCYEGDCPCYIFPNQCANISMEGTN